MTRHALGAVVAAALLSLAGAAVYGAEAARTTFVLLGPLGLLTVVVAYGVLARLRAGLRGQAAAVSAVVVAGVAAVMALFVRKMFLTAHDAFFSVLVMTYAGLLGLWAAWLFGRRALGDLEAVRATLGAVAGGRRDLRTGVRGGGELAHLAAEVDAMVARLAGEERARRSLVAAISHDLRTPITALRLLADAVEDGVVDADASREYAARMSTHVRALGELIDDLLELSRLESAELRWSMQRVALSELIRDTVDAMRPQADASGVTVEAILAAGDPLALGDPARLQRVLFNLLQNAIRHTPPDGAIRVSAITDADGVEIAVADTGSGIPVEERERVFAPFHRLDRARSDDGSGLGLAISRAIVEAHGGRIWVADSEVGTTVRLRLRRA